MLDKAFHILEIPSTANKEQIREAFHDLLKVWHPDRFADNPRLQSKAEQKTRDIICAYETIMLNRTRKQVSQPTPGPTPVYKSPEIKPHFASSFMASQGIRQKRYQRPSHSFSFPNPFSLLLSIPLVLAKLPLLLIGFVIQIVLNWWLGIVVMFLIGIMAIEIRSPRSSFMKQAHIRYKEITTLEPTEQPSNYRQISKDNHRIN